MSAEYIPTPAEAGEVVSPQPAERVEAEYADWGFVTGAADDRPLPTLVLGNGRRELHLELDADLLDELLASLTAQAHDTADGDYAEPADEEREPLTRRIGAKAATASGWPTADRWWRSTGSNTRIIVAGVIAAVMVLGLLVTF